MASGHRRAEEARQSLVRVGRFLGRRWWLLLLVTGGLLVGVYRFAQSLPKTYACSPVVMELIQDPPQGARTLEAYEYAVAGLSQFLVPTQQAVLKTGEILDPVVAELRLAGDPDYGSLEGKVQTSSDLNTSLISLTVRGPSPEKNAAVANEIARVYAEKRQKQRQTYMDDLLREADKQAKEREAALKSAEDALQEYRQKEKISDLQAEETSSRIRLGTLDAIVLTTRAEQAARDADLHEVEAAEKVSSDLGDVVVVRESPDVKAAQAEIDRLRQELHSIDVTETDAARRTRQMEVVQHRIDEESKAHAHLVAARVAHVKSAANEATLRAGETATSLDAEKANLDRIVRLKLQDDRLRLEVERAQREVAAAKSDRQAMREQKAHAQAPVKVWQNAQASWAIVSPNLTAIYIGGLILAFVLSLLFSVVLDLVSTRLNDPAAIGAAAQAPFLGIVPLFPARKEDPSPTRRVLEEVDGDATDAFRLISFTALLRGSDGDTPKTLLVTSPQAGDGKTTTAFGLASAIARSGLKVLLVDADLRKPYVHKALDIPGEPGLTNLFSGRSVWDAKRVVEMRAPGHDPVTFDVIPCGVLPPNPADLLAGPLMKAFLADASKRYAVTVIDSPPVNLVSDGCLLASMVDGVVLVTRAKKTHRGHIHRAVSLLRRVRARVRGVILNAARPNRGGGYGYRYGYGYGEGYGYGYGYGYRGRERYATDPGAVETAPSAGAPAGAPASGNGAAKAKGNGAAAAGESKHRGHAAGAPLRARVTVLPRPDEPAP